MNKWIFFTLVWLCALYPSTQWAQIRTVEQTYKNNSYANDNKSHLAKYRISSKILKNRRDIWIYTPAIYSDQGQPFPLLLVFDGQAYITPALIPLPQILDDLIASNQIQPVVTIFVSSIDQPARNLELPCYAPFVDFLASELLPWVQKNYNVSKNPLQTHVLGSSYGGLAACYAALKRPDLFGNVFSQSGAFWWKPVSHPREQWIVEQFANAPKLPVRFYLCVGKKENESSSNYSSILSVNQKILKVLQGNGYHVHYCEFDGGHEYKDWAKATPDGLIHLLKASNQ